MRKTSFSLPHSLKAPFNSASLENQNTIALYFYLFAPIPFYCRDEICEQVGTIAFGMLRIEAKFLPIKLSYSLKLICFKRYERVRYDDGRTSSST